MTFAAEHGFGLFGPDFGHPGGGFCVSAFLLVRDERGRLLVGRMAEHPRWEREWQPNLRYYEGAARRRAFEGWRLPATYLRVGEHPEAAALRVWRDQLGLEEPMRARLARIVSEAGPSRRYPTEKHWDLVFAFVGEAEPPARAPPHWAALEARPPDALREADLVMLHGELLPLARELAAAPRE